MIFKSDTTPTDLNGFLDAGSHIKGDLHFENTFRIDGKFTGEVKSDGNLIVGEGGHVEGSLEVGQIFISGRVEGQVRAHSRVQIASTGKVFAALDTPALVVEDGALFEGRCAMSRRPARPSVAPQRPEAVGEPLLKGGKVTQMPLKKER